MYLPRLISKLVRKQFAKLIAYLYTHEIAQVVSYNSSDNLASVQPCVQRFRSSDAKKLGVFSLPQLDDVPVLQRGSGKLLLNLAPQVGSYGILHFSDRCIEQWIADGGVGPPRSARKFDLSDCCFDPGLYPLVVDGDNGKLSEEIMTDRICLRTRTGITQIAVIDDETIQLSNALGSVTIDISGVVTAENKLVVNSEVDSAALTSKVDDVLSRLCNVFISWYGILDPVLGGGALQAAYGVQFPVPPLTVASSKIKVDA